MSKIFVCLFAVIFALPSLAQTPPRYTATVSAKYAYRCIWTKEKWQGDDTPYRAVRLQIEKALRAGKSADTLIAYYRNEYEQKPTDNLKLFAWACAVVLPRVLHLRDDTDFQYVCRAYDKSKPPHTFEYMRLRYLTEAQYGSNDYTTALGERLIAQDKNDFYILFYLWKDIMSDAPGAKEKSLGYARRIIELKPASPTGYVCMEIRYFSHWRIYGHHAEDGKQTIYWANEYIKHENRVGPQYKKNREEVKEDIKDIEKWSVAQK